MGAGGGAVATTMPPPLHPRDPISPATIAGAPNSRKHPATAIIPRRQSIRPENIAKPTNAIAMTAIAVAIGPSITSPIQRAADNSDCDPDGSDSETGWMAAIVMADLYKTFPATRQ